MSPSAVSVRAERMEALRAALTDMSTIILNDKDLPEQCVPLAEMRYVTQAHRTQAFRVMQAVHARGVAHNALSMEAVCVMPHDVRGTVYVRYWGNASPTASNADKIRDLQTLTIVFAAAARAHPHRRSLAKAKANPDPVPTLSQSRPVAGGIIPPANTPAEQYIAGIFEPPGQMSGATFEAYRRAIDDNLKERINPRNTFAVLCPKFRSKEDGCTYMGYLMASILYMEAVQHATDDRFDAYGPHVREIHDIGWVGTATSNTAAERYSYLMKHLQSDELLGPYVRFLTTHMLLCLARFTKQFSTSYGGRPIRHGAAEIVYAEVLHEWLHTGAGSTSTNVDKEMKRRQQTMQRLGTHILDAHDAYVATTHAYHADPDAMHDKLFADNVQPQYIQNVRRNRSCGYAVPTLSQFLGQVAVDISLTSYVFRGLGCGQRYHDYETYQATIERLVTDMEDACRTFADANDSCRVSVGRQTNAATAYWELLQANLDPVFAALDAQAERIAFRPATQETPFWNLRIRQLSRPYRRRLLDLLRAYNDNDARMDDMEFVRPGDRLRTLPKEVVQTVFANVAWHMLQVDDDDTEAGPDVCDLPWTGYDDLYLRSLRPRILLRGNFKVPTHIDVDMRIGDLSVSAKTAIEKEIIRQAPGMAPVTAELLHGSSLYNLAGVYRHIVLRQAAELPDTDPTKLLNIATRVDSLPPQLRAPLEEAVLGNGLPFKFICCGRRMAGYPFEPWVQGIYVSTLPAAIRPANVPRLDTELSELPAHDQADIETWLREHSYLIMSEAVMRRIRVGELRRRHHPVPGQIDVLEAIAWWNRRRIELGEQDQYYCLVTPATTLGDLPDTLFRSIYEWYVGIAPDLNEPPVPTNMRWGALRRHLVSDEAPDVYNPDESAFRNAYLYSLPRNCFRLADEALEYQGHLPRTMRVFELPLEVLDMVTHCYNQEMQRNRQVWWDERARALLAGVQIPDGVNVIALYRQKIGDELAALEEYVSTTLATHDDTLEGQSARDYLEQNYYNFISFMVPAYPCRIHYEHTARRTVWRNGRYEDVAETRTGTSLIDYESLQNMIEAARTARRSFTDPFTNQPITRLSFALDAYCDIVRVLDTYGTDALPDLRPAERAGEIRCPSAPAAS